MKNIILLGTDIEFKEEIGKILSKKLRYGFKNIKTEVKNQTKMPGQRRNKMLQKKKEKYIVRKLSKFAQCVIISNTRTTKDIENFKKLEKTGIFILIKSEESPEYLDEQAELIIENQENPQIITNQILDFLKQNHGIN